MTKKEAIAAMQEGKKVMHRFFLNDEFIYLKNGKIHDERDYNINSEFWFLRQDANWQIDWIIRE